MPGQKAPEGARREQILRAAYDVAGRRGLDGVTVREVARRAGLSSGLVLFHFKSKGRLLLELLDWLLATTTVLRVGPEIQQIPSAFERLLALLRQEMNRLSSDPRRIRLFFEFWVRGFRTPAIGARMQGELERYRTAFRPMVEEVLWSDPERFAGVSVDGLAAVAVSFIKGCAVQSIIAPDFDIDRYLVAAEALLGHLVAQK